MVQKIAVKQRLALLGQAQRVVNFVARLARHHAAQVLHVGTRYLHVHHEVGPRKAEQHQQVVFTKQRGVYFQQARTVVQYRKGKAKLIEAVDQLAHNVATLVAEKQAAKHLNLKIGAQLGIAQTPGHDGAHQCHIALQVVKRQAQVKVLHQLQQYRVHGAQCGVVAVVGGPLFGFVIFDVLGANRRTHKNKVILKITAVQDLGGDRVEKGFCQFGLMVVDQQADVMQLHLLPYVHGLLTCLEFALQPGGGLAHPQVVKLDPLPLGALLTVPVSRLEPVLGPGRLSAKQAVMAVKAVHHGFGNVVSNRGIKTLWKHGDLKF